MVEHLATLGTRGPALFAVAGTFALAFLVGRPWVRRAAGAGGTEEAFLALTLGFDLLAVGVVPLAALGALSTWPVRAVLAAALAIVAFQLVARARSQPPRFPAGPALLFAGFGLVVLAHGLSPPFAWDDLVYHVAVPQRWHETRSLQVFPDNPYSGFPGAASMLNLLLIEAGGILAPGVFNAALWLLLSLLVWAQLGARMGRWQGAIFALSFALSWPVVTEAISAYAEIFLVLQIAAIACLMLRGPDASGGERRGQVLLGVFAASAAAIKLTGLIVPLLTVGLLAVGEWFRPPRSPRTILARSGPFLLPFVALLAFFLARPALATGNPLHPYFAWCFTGGEAALASSVYHHDAGTERFGVELEPSVATVGHVLRIPFLLALGPFGDIAEFDGWIGLQFCVHFLLFALLLLARTRARVTDVRPWVMLACALALYAFWFLTSQQTRFLMPACYLLTLGASFAWPLVARVPRAVLTATLPLLTLASIPRENYYLMWMVARLQSGAATPVEYIDFANPDRYVYACQAILEQTPPDARVMLLYENRGLYIPREYRIGTPFFQARYFTPSENTRTAEEFLAVLGQEGITHVLVGYNVNDPDRMESYLERTRPFQGLIVSMIGSQLQRVFELQDNDAGVVRHGLYEVKSP